MMQFRPKGKLLHLTSFDEILIGSLPKIYISAHQDEKQIFFFLEGLALERHEKYQKLGENQIKTLL
jgi:hypothetical protein